jgi:hypothetical protein
MMHPATPLGRHLDGDPGNLPQSSLEVSEVADCEPLLHYLDVRCLQERAYVVLVLKLRVYSNSRTRCSTGLDWSREN